MDKILIIIPAFNEEKNIQSVIMEIQRQIPTAEILVINDGSSDRTATLAESLGAKVFTHAYNLGYGMALQTGYKYALKNGFDVVIQMDGDGQHDSYYIPAILQQIQSGGADIVLGSRFIHSAGYRIPFCRKMGMRLFAFLASWLCGHRFTDTTSGLRGFNKKALEFCVGENYPRDYPDANALVMMHRAGFQLREIPVKMRPNEQNHSMHSGVKPIFYVCKMLFNLKWRRVT